MAGLEWRLGDNVRLEGDNLVDGSLDRTWTLNPASLLIISELLRGASVQHVTEAYAAEFEVSLDEASQDVIGLISALERQQLLATRKREAAIARRAAVDQVMYHPVAQAFSRTLLAAYTWYFRLINKVLGRDSVG